MGIRQQVRPDAPHPEVRETDYGAQFVKAATETKEQPDVVTLEEQKENVETPEAPVEEKTDEKPRKRGGRTKKQKK